jgi:hypothetical protein
MKFTPEHDALRQTWKTLIDREINPHVDEWEKEASSPPTSCSRRWAMPACWASTSRCSSAARASISPTP